MLEGMPGAPVTDETELGQRMTNFVTTVRQDTDEIYGRLDEAQEARAVLSGRLNLLGRDRCSHAYIALLMEREARLSHEARGRSLDTSDTARSEAQLMETLRLMSSLQIHVTALQRQRGPTRGLAQPKIPEELYISLCVVISLTAALAARDADRSMNGDDNYNLGTGVRRNERAAHETVGHDVAYAMTWADLKKKMTDKYCPRTEIKKLEVELWNLKVKGTDEIGYNQHFQELSSLCVRMFPEESDKIER
ncbi:reverse transcriptase domain-containing protein [Tanacetum coccineum]